MVFGKDQTNKGKKFSEEHRLKISNSLIGKFKGKSYEEIMGKEKAEIRREQQRQNNSGENNFFWQGGKVMNYDWKKFNLKFKNKVRERDNQICMNCGIHREKLKKALDIHHIDYNEQNTIPQNCISLCRKCHGLTQLNKEYWICLFREKLSKLYGYSLNQNEVIVDYV